MATSVQQSLPRWPYLAAGVILVAGVATIVFGHDHAREVRFQSRGAAMAFDPVLVFQHAFSDSVIALSYLVISAILTWIAYQAWDVLPFKHYFLAFAAFIVTCGLTHVMAVVTIWSPAHVLAAIVKYVTAVASIGTAIAIPMLVPKIRAMIDQQAFVHQRQRDLERAVKQRTEQTLISERRAHNLVGQVVAAHQEERKQLSYHVHDSVTQTAIATHQHLQAFARNYLPKLQDYVDECLPERILEELRADLSSIQRLAQRTIIDSRQVIEDLSPQVLHDFGIVPALHAKIERRNQQGQRITFDVERADAQLLRCFSQVEAVFYQMAREALNNVAKHAPGSNIRLTLETDPAATPYPTAVLCVEDDGPGFDTTTLQKGSGSGPGERIGLKAMQERVNLMGGHLTISSHPGKGTRVCAEIPMRFHHDDDNHEEGRGA